MEKIRSGGENSPYHGNKKKAKEKAKEILKLHANSWSNFIAYVRTF
jgi:hypothetical protein